MARNAWAPDISYFNGKYHLYYSVSSFGSRNSAIGLATTRTLDPSSPDYRWTDEGMVLRSYQDKDDWNAIDPNLVLDGDRAWLVWGSFWGGIKMRRVDPSSGKLSADGRDDALAEQPSARAADQRVRRGSVHRPSRRLLVPVRLVRSLLPRRPEHLQRRRRPLAVGDGSVRGCSGKPMTEGGGTLVIEATTPTWRGPGHPAVFSEGGKDFMFFHAYFGEGRGRGSALQISTLVWEDGWPKVGRAAVTRKPCHPKFAEGSSLHRTTRRRLSRTQSSTVDLVTQAPTHQRQLSRRQD